MQILDQVKNATGVEYIAALEGKRHMLRCETSIIKLHPDLAAIRGKDPQNLNLLTASIEKEGAPVYPPCVYAEVDPFDQIHFYVADGHQRLTAAKSLHQPTIEVLFMEAWKTVKEAVEGAVGLQFAHYATDDRDIISLLRSGKLLQAEIVRLTGYEASKVSRLAKIKGAEFAWLFEAVQSDLIRMGDAGKLADACNDNRDKIAALAAKFTDFKTKAEAEAKFWENSIKSSNKKWGAEALAKAKLSHYFRKIDWTTWIAALSNDGQIQEVRGVQMLRVDDSAPKPSKNGVYIGTATDWKEKFAVFGIFGNKISDVEIKDVQDILSNWGHIKLCLEAIVEGRPVPSRNPTIPITPPAAPAPQKPTMLLEPGE